MRLFRRRRERDGYAAQYDHPTQLLAATFLRAAAENDLARLWESLSLESRGLLEGRYALRAGLALARAAGVESERDARLAAVVAPLRARLVAALGGVEAVNATGVSGARLVSRGEAYVLLLPDFGEERMVREEEWRPSHLLAFVYEEREWRFDLGRTAALSAEGELPDPLDLLR